MLDDMTASIEAEAETELELLEGLRVLGRITALCSELSLDVDVEAPWFFPMNSGRGSSAARTRTASTTSHDRRRATATGSAGSGARPPTWGSRCSPASGLTPRRMAAYVSDSDLAVGRRRVASSSSWPRPSRRPTSCGGDRGSRSPRTRRPSSCASTSPTGRTEELAELTIEPLDPSGPPAPPTDAGLGEQLTGMAWTIAKLTTLHRTIRPELLDQPNELVTAEAADLGAADTTPDNLYMIGTFRLAAGRGAGASSSTPPATRYWSVTLENIWHECIDPRRRRSSLTNAAAARRAPTVACASSSPADRSRASQLARHRRPPPRLRPPALARQPRRPRR